MNFRRFILLMGSSICIAACANREKEDLSNRLALAFGEQLKVNPWDEEKVLRSLRFKIADSDKKDVFKSLTEIQKKHPFCDVSERNGRVVLSISGKHDLSYERYKFVFSFDSNEKLSALVVHQESGPEEIIRETEK